MKAILPLAILLLVVGIAAAVNVEAPINAITTIPTGTVGTGVGVSYEDLSGYALLTGVPGFAAGWANAAATVTVPDGAVKNVTVITSISINKPTGVTNTRVDPTANLNISTVSVSGTSQTTKGINLKDLNTEAFDSIAVASGSAVTSAQGIHEAWTVGQFQPVTSITVTGSGNSLASTASSTVMGGAAAIADFKPIV
jgi:hypothetical protein